MEVEVKAAIFVVVCIVLIILFIIIGSKGASKNEEELIKQDVVPTDDKPDIEDLKVGKYYNSKLDYQAVLQKAKDNKLLAKLKSEWLNALDKLNDDVDKLEHSIESCDDPIKKLEAQAQLQPMYERQAVGQKYLNRFSSAANLPFLNAIFQSGYFCSLQQAEEKQKHYDNILYFQTDEYTKLKSKASAISVILGILSLPTFMFVIGAFANGFLNSVSSEGYLDNPLGTGFYLFWLGSVVTIPLWILIAFYAIPKAVDSAILGDRISDEDKKAKAVSRGIAVTSGLMAGAKAGHDIKKINEKYDRKYKE